MHLRLSNHTPLQQNISTSVGLAWGVGVLPGGGGPKYFGGSGAVLEFCVFNHPRTYNISAWFEVEIGGWVGWGGKKTSTSRRLQAR